MEIENTNLTNNNNLSYTRQDGRANLDLQEICNKNYLYIKFTFLFKYKQH